MPHAPGDLPLITHRAVNDLLAHLSRESTLSKIDRLFQDAGIACDARAETHESGQRRHLARQHLATLDLTRKPDAEKLLRVFEDVLLTLDDRSADVDDDPQGAIDADRARAMLLRALQRSKVQRTDHHLHLKVEQADLETLDVLAAKLDSASLRRQVKTMNENIVDHPEVTIGLAKDLLESVCKTILEERGAAEGSKPTLPQLVKTTAGVLKLLPDEASNQTRGAAAVKQLAGGLGGLVQGMAEIRNLYGSGHGRSARAKGIPPRHARLAAGTASTLAVFLWETHLERPTAEDPPTASPS